TNLDHFEHLLADHLARFLFEAKTIRLSGFLQEIVFSSAEVDSQGSSESERLAASMDAAKRVRQLTQRADILALFAVALMNQARGDRQQPLRRRAHILRSLKHPDEVQTLRQIYGEGFFLIGVYSSEKERLRYLQKEAAVPETRALELIHRDQEEADPFGQKTRDTFHLADVFISLQQEPTQALQRFLDLLFGHPYITPTADESAMFIAYSSSLRSASLSRQGGAVVTSEEGEVIAVGANDVPCFGGGLYWPDAADQRDHEWSYDSHAKRRGEIILDVMRRLRPADTPDDDLLEEGRKLLRGSQIHDL